MHKYTRIKNACQLPHHPRGRMKRRGRGDEGTKSRRCGHGSPPSEDVGVCLMFTAWLPLSDKEQLEGVGTFPLRNVYCGELVIGLIIAIRKSANECVNSVTPRQSFSVGQF